MRRATVPALDGDHGRTNEDWIAHFHNNRPVDIQAQEELRTMILRGLGRVFANQSDLDNSTLEDLTQETLIRVTTKLGSFRGDSRFTTWVMSIAIRVVYTALRQRRWCARSLDDLDISLSDKASSTHARHRSQSDSISRSDLLVALREAIDRDLTPRQRAAILGELAGMPCPVLAEQLHTNTNALYKLHHDARLRLRASLQSSGYAESDVMRLMQEASDC